MSFFTSYTKTKIKSLIDDATSVIINADLDGATQAQLDMYYQKLRELSQKTVVSQEDYDNNLSLLEAAKADYNKKLDIANVLNKNLESETDEAKKESITKSLNLLFDTIDTLKADIDKKTEDLSTSKEILDSWKEARDLSKEKLDKAQAQLKSAQARIAKAKADSERSKELLQARQSSAGVGSSSKIDLVINKMNDIAKNAETEAKVNQSMSESLAPKKEVIDENIQKAMDEVNGVSHPTNIKDRLSGYKKL